MPLEFGVFLGGKVFGSKAQKQKMCSVFDELPYRYQKYVLDISGQDIESHHNDPKLLIRSIRDWLASLYSGVRPSGSVIWERYQRFQKELVGLCGATKQRIEELTYSDLLKHVRDFAIQKADVLETDLEGRRGGRLDELSLPHIREAIEDLTGGGDPFVILTKSGAGRSYLQVAGSKVDGYSLKYQEGSLDNHYRCVEDNLDEEQVITAFQAYRRNEASWKISLSWES